MTRSRRPLRAALVVSALAGAVVFVPVTAIAAPYTITYDWQGNPGAGVVGVDGIAAPVQVPAFDDPTFQTPFYATTAQAGQGVLWAPAVSSMGVGSRPFVSPDASLDGPRAITQFDIPDSSLVREATFSQISYRDNTGEQQALRLAIYGGGDPEAHDLAPPPDGPYAPGMTHTGLGPFTVDPSTNDGTSVQIWMATSCEGDCPIVDPTASPPSHGRVGKVEIELDDTENPTVGLAGALTTAGWTTGIGAATVTITGTDPGAGIRQIRLARKRKGGNWRTLVTQNAPCDLTHTQARPAGRSAAPCLNSFPHDYTQQLAGLAEGQYTYRATVTDNSGRTASQDFPLRIDRKTPTAKLAGSIRKLGKRWTNGTDNVGAAVTGKDTASGVQVLEVYAKAGGTPKLLGSLQACDPNAVSCPKKLSKQLQINLGLVADGKRQVFGVVRDRAGNQSKPSKTVTLKLDRRAPEQPGPATKAKARNRQLTASWRGVDDPGHEHSGLAHYRVQILDATSFVARNEPKPVRPREKPGLRIRRSQGMLKNALLAVTTVDEAGNNSAARVVPIKPSRARKKKPKPKRVPLRPTPKKLNVQFGFSDGNWDRTFYPDLPNSMQPSDYPADAQADIYVDKTVTPPVLHHSRLETVRLFRKAIETYARRHKATFTQKFVSLRIVAPYDLWRRPPSSTSVQDWTAFKKAVEDYNRGVANWNGTRPDPVKVAVSIGPYNNDPCAKPLPLDADDAPGPCLFPGSRAVYRLYFQDWIKNTGTDGEFPAVTEWAAWNEPDHVNFTLGGLDTHVSAELAADYWLEAQWMLNDERAGSIVAAGETAGYDSTWAETYMLRIINRIGGENQPPEPPQRWSIHAYGDLYQGNKRRSTVRSYASFLDSHRKALGDYRIWVTETGVQLITPGQPGWQEGETDYTFHDRPADQFNAGRFLMRMAALDPAGKKRRKGSGWRQRVERIYYYGTWADNPKFDSGIADADGDPRPVLCGIRDDRTLNHCNGIPRHGGTK